MIYIEVAGSWERNGRGVRKELIIPSLGKEKCCPTRIQSSHHNFTVIICCFSSSVGKCPENNAREKHRASGGWGVAVGVLMVHWLSRRPTA